MKWRAATKEDLIDMGRKFWRDIDKSNMSPGLAYTMFHKGISIEVLDESTPAEDWVKVDTVGKILKRQMEIHGLIVGTVDKELKLLGYLQRLIDDEIYTNSIPIMLFINLLKSLHITFDEIEPLMLPTFKVVLSKETEESIKKKKAGYGLWECEEAIEKYTNRLKELITT